MNEIIKEFFKSGIVGGIFIGIYSIIIKYWSSAIAAQLNGALPLGFLFIILYTYFIKGKEKATNANFVAIMGGFLWLFFVTLFYLFLRLKVNIILILIINILLFLIINYCMYKLLINYY